MPVTPEFRDVLALSSRAHSMLVGWELDVVVQR